MRGLLKSKRGISPLIATILLIAFAVALGAVVMQFGAGLESSGCGADVQIVTKNACIAGNLVKVDVKNNGAADIPLLKVWVHGAKDGIKTKDIKQILARGGTTTAQVEYDIASYGAATSIDVIPIVEGVQCVENKVTITSIGTC